MTIWVSVTILGVTIWVSVTILGVTIMSGESIFTIIRHFEFCLDYIFSESLE